MIRILTDSAADLTCADAALPGVTVVPLQVNFANGDTALDGVDITGDEYYARLKNRGQAAAHQPALAGPVHRNF